MLNCICTAIHNLQFFAKGLSKMIIDRQLPRVIIDQRQCFSEAGLKGIADFSAESVQYAYQKAAEGIDQIVYEGNRMAMIENDMPDAVSEIAFEKGLEYKDWTIDIIPKSRPKIEIEGHLNIDWEAEKLNSYKENYQSYKTGPTTGNTVDTQK
jgi:hypothetical protein